MNYRHWAVAGIIMLSASLNSVKGQQKGQLIPLDTAVRTGKLSNGFTYYIRRNNEPDKRALFYLVNKVGSILEDDDQRGLAHFMEHMNFNGTTHFPKNELISYLQKIGVRFGADLNAYTSYEETVYQLPIPTDNPTVVMKGLDIMRDWAKGALLKTADINKERGIIIEEKRLRAGVGNRLQEKTIPVVLNHSRYSYRSPIGTDSVILNSSPETLRRFYQDWYRPNLQALIVVGDVNVDQVEKQIKKQFGNLKNPENQRARPDYKIPLTGKNQFLLFTDPEITTTELKIVVKHPGVEMKTTTDYLNAVKVALFNQMISYRFSELSQRSNPPYNNINAAIGNLTGGLMQFAYAVSAKPGKLQEAVNSTWSLIEQVKSSGFTQGELDRAKTSYMAGLDKQKLEESKTPSSSYVSAYQQLFLNEAAAPGFDWAYNFMKKELPGITVEDVNAIANQYLVETNRDVFVIAPEKEKSNLPDSVTLNTWLAKLKSSSHEQYIYIADSDVLVNELPGVGKLVSRTNIPVLGAQKLILSNGVKVWLKPTTFKNDQIQFLSFAPGGINNYSNADYPTASNAAGIIGGAGVGRFSSIQLSKILNGKSVSVNAYISGRGQGINGACSSGDLETALQLIYLRYTAPRKDTVMFENAIARFREQIRNRYNDPGNVFRDTIGNVLSGYHHRLSPITEERLDSISLERAFEIYKDRFADAADANFVFVGNFNIDSIAPLLERYLGSLPVLHRKEKSDFMYTAVPKGKLIKIVEKGNDNRATVLLVYNGNCKFSENESMQLQALSEILQYRLMTSLREKAGEVYTPAVQSKMEREPYPRFFVNVSFGCAPEHVEHLVGLVQKDIADLQQGGASKDELQKFKAGTRQQAELQKNSNGFWLQYIADKVERKEENKPDNDLEQLLSKITSNSIRDASKTYLSGENSIRFVALPEKK